MENNKKQEIQRTAKKLTKFFKIELTISIFGQTIIHWVYPPQKEE